MERLGQRPDAARQSGLQTRLGGDPYLAALFAARAAYDSILDASTRHSCHQPPKWPISWEVARFWRGGQSAPQSLEAVARCTGVVDRMPRVAMAEVILGDSQVIAF